ncbi:hypothetical protein PHYC_01665 [Phycisphaerales bacterium]|nr:hypothetical protein PHYC_01665 [Phycisphaerales bacterium]
MNQPLRFAILLTSLASPCALAQGPMPTRVFPASRFWQEHPAGEAPAEAFAAMQRRNVHYAADYPNPGDATPEAAANMVCNYILANFDAGRISATNTTVLLGGWGHDWYNSQPGWVDPPDPSLPQGHAFLPDLGFFQPITDALVGLSPQDFRDPPNPFPLNFPMQPGDNQRLEARAWRHPFTINATQGAVLRQWTQRFVNQVNVFKQATPRLPDPRQWGLYLDSEPFILFTGERNGVFMPHYLATARRTDIWNTWPVPGSPGWQPPSGFPLQPNETRHGMTLDEMYNAVRVQNGWPENPGNAFDPESRADTLANRSAMIWWMNLWQRAADAVVANCFYDVVKPAWPGCRFGNWDTSSVDGVNDTTPWYLNPPPTWPYNPSNELKRCILDPNPAMNAYPLTRHNLYQGSYDVWAGIVQHSSGTNFLPYLYPLNCKHLDGLVTLNGVPCSYNPGFYGHRQPDLYIPGGGVPEEDFTTALRLERHALDSIINSFNGGNQTKLSPWIYEFVADPAQLPEDPYRLYREETNQRAQYAMLYGMNVPELLQWTGVSNASTQALRAAWRHTVDIVKRSYLVTVANIKPAWGELPPYTPEYEPSMLEFTLRTPLGEPYTAKITDNISPYAERKTLLQVALQGFDAMHPLPDYECSTYDLYFDIFVEGWVSHSTSGSILLYNQISGDWDEYPYGMGSTPDGRFRVRMSTLVCVNAATRYISPDGKVLMRLLHVMDEFNPGEVTSAYDFVHVIPYPACPCSGGEPEGSYAASDMNLDQNVAIDDVDQFLNSWLDGAVLADVNVDGQVDLTDIQAFEQSFAGANP